MRRAPLLVGPAAAVLSLAWGLGCASGPPAKPGEKAPPARPAAERRPAKGARPAVVVPQISAPSGVVYRVGLKSDLPEFSYGYAGEAWLVVSGGRADVLRGPIVFRPVAVATSRGGFSVQAAAFSQEEPARRSLEKLSTELQTGGTVAFSAERGVYRVLLGSFATRDQAEALVARIRSAGGDAMVVPGAATGPARDAGAIDAASAEAPPRKLASPVEIFPPGEAAPGPSAVRVDAVTYRGSLSVVVNPRGTLNVVNRLDLEEYLYGVVPAEMGPKRYDEIEALKAQAVAARTYAYAHRAQFEAEGYDLCATPKCQVYSGLPAEDPLTNGAVDATRGLVIASGGTFADALFISTCGGRTENVENVFTGDAAPYLVSVECGELATSSLAGARTARGSSRRGRTGLEWRGYVLERHAPRRRGGRAAWVEVGQRWAGIEKRARPASSLEPASVYPSILAAFDLLAASNVHLRPREERYYAEYPPATGRLTGAARDAYAFLLRFRFGAGEPLPPPDRPLDDEEYAGLLFSGGLRLLGITETSGRFLSREGSNLWVRTAEGRVGLPVDPDLPLARRVGDRWFVSSTLALRPGDRLRWWKRGSEVLALWVELDPAGPTYERESSWTEWVRRASGRELARRMSQRVAGTEVRDLTVTKRSPSGRVVEMRVTTDAAEVTLRGFDVRQALEMPELLFTFSRARGPDGELEFVFLGRGWGHGVGLCQNGAYGMALAGATYDAILRHYYTGVDIVTAAGVNASAAPSLR
ncbi:MAG TPA: SpoIID/LytB domain-containing protein [Thermoanaerobaculia bacterium]|nr:SpoIID/LytB domain-containing protein [Thermoanaerobaculia bacterium]